MLYYSSALISKVLDGRKHRGALVDTKPAIPQTKTISYAIRGPRGMTSVT